MYPLMEKLRQALVQDALQNPNNEKVTEASLFHLTKGDTSRLR
jgi:hypothetical protein